MAHKYTYFLKYLKKYSLDTKTAGPSSFKAFNRIIVIVSSEFEFNWISEIIPSKELHFTAEKWANEIILFRIYLHVRIIIIIVSLIDTEKFLAKFNFVSQFICNKLKDLS